MLAAPSTRACINQFSIDRKFYLLLTKKKKSKQNRKASKKGCIATFARSTNIYTRHMTRAEKKGRATVKVKVEIKLKENC